MGVWAAEPPCLDLPGPGQLAQLTCFQTLATVREFADNKLVFLELPKGPITLQQKLGRQLPQDLAATSHPAGPNDPADPNVILNPPEIVPKTRPSAPLPGWGRSAPLRWCPPTGCSGEILRGSSRPLHKYAHPCDHLAFPGQQRRPGGVPTPPQA